MKNPEVIPLQADRRVLLLGVGIAGCLFGVRFFTEDVAAIPRFLGVMAAAFAFYFAALLLLRQPSSTIPAWGMVGIALLIQLAPYHGKPRWDHDAYRYHWDGLVLAHGVNPYQYAPGDHQLAGLRDDYWEAIDYKWVKTIYPPVTQGLLAGTYFLDPTPRRVLLLAMGFNLLCLGPLLLLLRARRVDEKWLVIYAWNPLLANEFAAGGHLDALSVFLLLAALYSLERERPGWTGLLLALSVMAKTQMVFVAPLLLWRSGWRGLVAFIAAGTALVLPFAGAGGDLLSGSWAYLRQWENNSGIFAVLRYLLGGTVARMICGALLLALTVGLTFRRGDVLLHMGLVLGALLLLSPTFFPWYVSWVLPLVCFYRTVTWIVIPFLLLAPYLFYYDKALAFAVRIPEILLMYVIGALEWGLWRRRRPATTSSAEATPSSAGHPTER